MVYVIQIYATIKINDHNAFTIYPNPSSGKILISMNGYTGITNFIVSNFSGFHLNFLKSKLSDGLFAFTRIPPKIIIRHLFASICKDDNKKRTTTPPRRVDFYQSFLKTIGLKWILRLQKL